MRETEKRETQERRPLDRFHLFGMTEEAMEHICWYACAITLIALLVILWRK